MAIDMESAAQADGRGSLDRSEQASAISRAMVGLLRRIAGRGPTRARTTIGRDHVLVMLEDSLGEGERTLVQDGHRDEVAAMRRAYQDAMETEASNLVSEITGRRVSRFMSANHLDPPDVAAEVFVFEPDGGPETPVEAEHREEQAEPSQ
jgi:uncharacterized protein YbcI